jgi:hypothetical protein
VNPIAAFERLPELVNGDDVLVRRGRFLTTTCLVAIGATPFYVTVEKGRIAALERGTRIMRPWSFAVRASEDAWTRLWAPIPEPGWHDLWALAKRREAVIEGDLHPVMANLQYLKDVLTAPRRLHDAG